MRKTVVIGGELNLSIKEFGYGSFHIIVVMNHREKQLKAEIQIRSFLQHAWAVVQHDNLYKTPFRVPKKWERSLIRLSAILENADETFVSLLNDLKEYEEHFRSYMSIEQIKDEIELLRCILDAHGTKGTQLQYRIAMMAMSIEDWPRAQAALEKARSIDDSLEVNRELGYVMFMKGEEQGGLRVLFDAYDQKGGDTDFKTLSYLGEIYKKRDVEKSLSFFEKAYLLTPSNPDALGQYLQGKIFCEAENGQRITFLPLISPLFQSGVQACRKRIEAEIDVETSYFNMGLFLLLMGRTYECLNAYAKALKISKSPTAVDKALNDLRGIEKAVFENNSDISVLNQMVQKLLLMGKAAKTIPCAKFEKGERQALKLDLEAGNQIFSPQPIIIMAGDCCQGI